MEEKVIVEVINLCIIILDIIRMAKEEEEEEEEVHIPACAETVAQIFLTGMKVINSARTAGAATEAVEVAGKGKGEDHIDGGEANILECIGRFNKIAISIFYEY